MFGHGPVDGTGAPLNELASYAECRAAGAHGVELDVRMTADGAIAVTHDPHLPDGRAVSAVARTDLPSQVPLLDQALDAATGLVVNVEIKNYPRDPGYDPDQKVTLRVLELLAGRSWRDQVLISCFDVAAVDLVRAEAPAVPTALLYLSRRPASVLLGFAADRGHPTVHPFESMVDETFMETARSLAMRVNVWTGDDTPTARLRELVVLGVDGLITPHITSALAAVRQGGGASTRGSARGSSPRETQ